MRLTWKSALHLFLMLFIALGESALAAQAGKSAGPVTRENQAKVESLLREAQEDFAKGDYAGAVRVYEQVVSLRPDSAEVLSNLGVAYHFAGRPQDAVAALQKALNLNPEMVPSNLLLGIDLVRLGRPQEALGPLDVVLKKDSANRDGLFALAGAYYGLKEFDRAAQTYRRNIAVRPDDADAWYGMGLCFEQVAEQTTRRMNELSQESSYNQRLLGEVLLEQGTGIEAEGAFLRALAATPKNEAQGLHAGLGFARLLLGEVNKASEQFAEELRLDPASLEAKLGATAVALERQDWPSAARSLCAVAATDPGYYQDRLNFLLNLLQEKTANAAVKGMAAAPRAADCGNAINLFLKELTSPQARRPIEQAFEVPSERPRRFAPPDTLDAARRAETAGRYSECARLLNPFQLATVNDSLLAAQCQTLSGWFFKAFESGQLLIKDNPRNLQALYWQAEAARKLAQASFDRAVNLKPDSWQGHVLLGDLYRQRKKWDVAISHYQKAAQLKPDSPGPLLGLATIYWQTGRNLQGEETLKNALKIDPDNHMANFILGDIYIRKHRFEEAIPFLQKHLSRPPGFLEAHGDLGKAYAALGKDKEAIAELLLASPSDQSGEIHFQLYTLYKRQGQLELARQALAESEKRRSQGRESQRRRLERVSSGSETNNPSQP